MMDFTVDKVTVFTAANFLNEVTAKYNFLGIYEILNITDSANLDCLV